MTGSIDGDSGVVSAGTIDGDTGVSENPNNENESRKGGVTKGEKEAPLLERYFNSNFKCWADKLSRCSCFGEGQVLDDGQLTDLPL